MNIDKSSQQSQWSASLFPSTCIITCCLPCITFGQIAHILDEGRSSCATQGCVYGCLMLFSCHWLLSCTYRQKLRATFGIPNDNYNDCCVHFCCEPCALCQEHEELKNRGFDPSKGWIGQPNVPPPTQMPPTMHKFSITN